MSFGISAVKYSPAFLFASAFWRHLWFHTKVSRGEEAAAVCQLHVVHGDSCDPVSPHGLGPLFGGLPGLVDLFFLDVVFLDDGGRDPRWGSVFEVGDRPLHHDLAVFVHSLAC
jgi:hypothetical protein